jgi:hypothetical protein
MISVQDWLQGIMAVFTLLMAVGTFYLAFETRSMRMYNETQDKHVAFRAAIRELAENVANLHAWYPKLESKPSESWLSQRFTFDSLSHLLNFVAVDPQVWQRTIALIRNLKAAEIILKSELIQQDQEKAKEFFYKIDIYLKQLARYVTVEMRLKGFPKEEASTLIGNNLMKPDQWSYGDSTLMEIQPIFPFSALPPEPTATAFGNCMLTQLVQEAHASNADSFPK